jgi:hypothetical protein
MTFQIDRSVRDCNSASSAARMFIAASVASSLARMRREQNGRSKAAGLAGFPHNANLTCNFTSPDDFAVPKRVTVVESQFEMIGQICEKSGVAIYTCAL